MIGRTNANADAILFEHIENIEKVVSVTLPLSGWKSNSSGLYSQEVSVTGITAQDMAQLLKYTTPSISEDDYTNYSADFSLITGGQSANGKITFYAKDILSQSITVYLGMGKKGDGRLLIAGSSSAEKQQISNVVMTITDNAAVAEGGAVKAECNGKSWTSTIKNGKAKLYASEVGNYTITVTTTNGTIYTTMLVCPYFGQFSTDIYSGTLVVTCTEAGGNGKTCNVRSCDDSYNATDAYNLTQTFDTSLKLTFLGIPSGKYLVTVDDKYVFFKEITSIQNINSVNVELRQYLYNKGDQCAWNTGGWMKCKDESESYIGGYVGADPNNPLKSVGIVNKNIIFKPDSILLSGSIKADAGGPYSYYNYGVYIRGGGKVNAYIGTSKPLPITILKYKSLRLAGSNSDINYSIRVGVTNDENTTTASATILQSGSGENAELVLGDSYPYMVIGQSLEYGYYGDNYSSGVQAGGLLRQSPGNLDVLFSAQITEIYLV